MWVYDLGTLLFLEVNDAAIRHYGYTREEFLRMRVTDVFVPEELPRVEAVLADVTVSNDETVRRHARTFKHRLKDGAIRDVDVASHALDFAGRRARWSWSST